MSIKRLLCLGFFCISSILATIEVSAKGDLTPPQHYLVRKPYETPIEMLREVSDQMIEAIKENKQALKKDHFLAHDLVRKYMVPYIDRTRVAQRVLMQHWRNATQEQREKLQDELTFRVIETYSSAIQSYEDEKVIFNPKTKQLKSNRYHKRVVQGCFQPNSTVTCEPGQSGNGPDKAIALDFYVIQADNTWLVYDLVVEGISVIKSYRAQFQETLGTNPRDNKGVQRLIDQLKEKNDEIRNGKKSTSS